MINSIDNLVKTTINEDLYISEVLCVDSSLGFELGPRWPDVGIVEDPFNTLNNCYIFIASRAFYSEEDSIGGTIGIFRNNQIIWHSNNLIKIENAVLAGYIWSIKDINNDGDVEIMTTWISRNSYDLWPNGGRSPFMFLYIISWDGNNGVAINNIDENGNSSIMISSNGLFRFADLEGDGICEIQGYAFPENSEDSLHVNEENSFVLRTYSWNGNLYDRWPSTPQPFENDFYPKDKIDFNVYATVTNVNDSLEYTYSLTSLPSSFQDIEEMALEIDIEISNMFTPNECWGIAYREDTSAVVLWVSKYIHCYNFIKPGESKTLFKLKVSQETLPTISDFHASGWNTDSYDYYGIFTNSVKKITVAPSFPPVPFIALDFLDTLIDYNQRSFQLGWITNQTTADKYDTLCT